MMKRKNRGTPEKRRKEERKDIMMGKIKTKNPTNTWKNEEEERKKKQEI